MSFGTNIFHISSFAMSVSTHHLVHFKLTNNPSNTNLLSSECHKSNISLWSAEVDVTKVREDVVAEIATDIYLKMLSTFDSKTTMVFLGEGIAGNLTKFALLDASLPFIPLPLPVRNSSM